MYEYTPWATKVLSRILAITSDVLPILDIQFGGACNLNCIYCDTPKYHAPCSLDVDAIEKIISNGNILWVYACGLGEPTAIGNMETFKQILKISQKNQVKVSVFSNILNLDDDILNFIDNGTLNVLFKLDSFSSKVVEYLYGKDVSETILNNYQKLKEVTHIENGTTNLGASIVPTKANFKEIYKIVDYCMDNDIFPLLGQLENAGRCSSIYEDLELKEPELIVLRNYISQKYNIEYEIPVCPATISSIHITNTNKVIVDEKTGLSCAWFWMEDPKMVELADIRDISTAEILSKIIEYRKEKFSDVVEIAQNLSNNTFGGCGGDAKTLLTKYIDIVNY